MRGPAPHVDMVAVLGSVREWLRGMWEGKAAVASAGPGRPVIEALPLGHSEPSLRSLPLSTDAPRALALRRIHIVNHGAGTVLHDWDVRAAVPNQAGAPPARVVSEEEWAVMSRGVVRDDDVPVLCRGHVLHAPKNRRIKRDVPFVVEGLLPDEVRPGCIAVCVLFRDRSRRTWRYSV